MVTLGNNVKIIEELILFGWMNIKILTSNKDIVCYSVMHNIQSESEYILSIVESGLGKFYAISRAGIWGKKIHNILWHKFVLLCMCDESGWDPGTPPTLRHAYIDGNG